MLKQKLLEVTNKLKNIEDKSISWELTKLQIRNVTLPYCIKKKKEVTELENNLNNRFIELHNLIQLNQHEDIHVEYNTIKQELEQIERNEEKGVILRSKCKWAEDGGGGAQHIS